MQIITPRNYLPRTGQTTSYAAGDDGDLQAGNPRATRCIDNGNGTITDRATGLQWVRQPGLVIPGATGVHASNQIQAARGNWADATAYAAADLVCDTIDGKFYVCIHAHTSEQSSGVDTDAPNTGSAYWRETAWTASAANLTTSVAMAWPSAVANCAALEYAGYTDWRLPNLFELITARDWSGSTDTSAWPSAFPATTAAKQLHWSSTTRGGSSDSAVMVVFNSASGYAGYPAAKTTGRYARPVRGGRTNG